MHWVIQLHRLSFSFFEYVFWYNSSLSFLLPSFLPSFSLPSFFPQSLFALQDDFNLDNLLERLVAARGERVIRPVEMKEAELWVRMRRRRKESQKKEKSWFLFPFFSFSFLLQHCRIFADGANCIDGLTWRSAPAAQVPALGAPWNVTHYIYILPILKKAYINFLCSSFSLSLLFFPLSSSFFFIHLHLDTSHSTTHFLDTQ